MWVAPVEEAVAEGSLEPIPLDGRFLLAVSIPGTTPRPDGELPAITVEPDGLVQDVAYTGGEGGANVLLGLRSSHAAYRIASTNDPYEVLIDVRPVHVTA